MTPRVAYTLQSAAGEQDAGLAQQVHRGRRSPSASRCWPARAAYVQVFDNDFFQKQGEVPLRPHAGAAGQPRPHPRPQRPDPGVQRAGAERSGRSRRTSSATTRVGQARAGSPSCSTCRRRSFDKKLEDDDKTFVWLQRQVDEPVAKEVAALDIKGIYQRREYKRKYPEGEAAAHVVGFTNVEDRGQEGIELAFNKELAGTRRHAPRHQGPARPRRRGRRRQRAAGRRPGHRSCAIDTQGAVLRLPEASATRSPRNKAKAGSVVVLDAQTGEVLALANCPSYAPERPPATSPARSCATARSPTPSSPARR